MKTNSDSPRLLRDRDAHVRSRKGKKPQITAEICVLEEIPTSSFPEKEVHHSVCDVALSRNQKPCLNKMCISS